MGTKFDTCFFERYAMISLRTLVSHRFDSLVNEDRPDLQSPDHRIGIEVTRAMEESKSAATALLLEMAGIDIPDDNAGEDKMDYQEIMDSGYAYGLQSGKYIGRKEYEYWNLALPLRRIIASKVSKVKSGFYGDYKEYGLYIFSKDQLSEEKIDAAMKYTADLQEGASMYYSFLFISLSDGLYACDLSSGKKVFYPMDQQTCRTFFRKALDSNSE